MIAHEVGHHVQNLLGIMEQTAAAAAAHVASGSTTTLSVRVELQADCFAGVWAHHANRTRKILEPGDLEEALRAATAIGDDRLQKQAQGYVVPDSFTHGSAAQRSRWFRTRFRKRLDAGLQYLRGAQPVIAGLPPRARAAGSCRRHPRRSRPRRN